MVETKEIHDSKLLYTEYNRKEKKKKKKEKFQAFETEWYFL